jgi:hypothetical protein
LASRSTKSPPRAHAQLSQRSRPRTLTNSRSGRGGGPWPLACAASLRS